MVDLRISNNKLFHRTVGIIQDLIGVDEATATQALIRSVYKTDSLTDAQRNAPISDHIEASKEVTRLVPTALLIATGTFSWQQASDTLDTDPVVRHAISSYVK
jgi:N-acetylmuramic acid 6-phosphate (MurNAc-6-P) etherase